MICLQLIVKCVKVKVKYVNDILIKKLIHYSIIPFQMLTISMAYWVVILLKIMFQLPHRVRCQLKI